MFDPISGPSVWTGSELQRDASWRRRWAVDEIAAVDRALAGAKSAGADWTTVAQKSFAAEDLAGLAAEVADALETGPGFVLLEGFPVDDYSLEDLRLIWMGLGHCIGRPVPQDNQGQMMRDIQAEPGDLGARHERMERDDGSEFLSSKARTYSNGELRFHTDRTDVVGLLMVRDSARGGESRIASTAAVHNEILRRRPDLLECLYRPIHRSRLGEERGGGEETYPLPVFGVRDGKLTSHYSRTYVEAAQLAPATPRMSDADWEALDLLAAVANDLSYGMRLRPGDMQFLNSHVTYHARSAFQDDADAGKARLLLRLWLSMPNSRALPEDHAILWGDVAAGALRGGIGQG